MVKSKYVIQVVFVSVFVLAGFDTFAQKKYLIYLKDKTGTSFSIERPLEFLSQKAIDRRQNRTPVIEINNSDLPVNSNYVNQIKVQGADVWYTSKWLNAVMVESDDATLAKIQALSCVDKTEPLTKSKGQSKKVFNYINNNIYSTVNTSIDSPEDYGSSLNQISQLGADLMHKQGLRGKGMTIAVFDSGFDKVDQNDAFKHIFAEKRMLGTYNFVENNNYVFGTGDHGCQTFSCLAAFVKGKTIGTAPDASYYLFRTEDTGTENKIEEVNWLLAAEQSDSLGVDVISSSLGYNDFDDNTMSYVYKDMDGRTAISSIAANKAASKGILVVNSAGNEGDSNWKYVAAPADADSIISVAAVDKNGKYVYFSSKGKTSDGRLKPNLAAKGLGSTVVVPSGVVSTSSGTSFACPSLAGFAASFWQANPTLNNMQVIDFLQQSGSQVSQPDTLLGYGIPDFTRATQLVKIFNEQKKKKKGFLMYPNPIERSQKLGLILNESFSGKDLSIEFFNVEGQKVKSQSYKNAPQLITYSDIANFNTGFYLVKMSSSSLQEIQKLVIN